MSRNVYTFSRTRLFVHFFLLLFTALTWTPFGIVWEVYRYFKNN